MTVHFSEQARLCWARTKLKIWPEQYWLVALPFSEIAFAAEVMDASGGSFGSIIQDQREVTLTIAHEVWRRYEVEARHHDAQGPFRTISFDLPLDIDLVGYLAPAAQLLAEAGVSIVPQCAFVLDHLLVQDKDLDQAKQMLQTLIDEADFSKRYGRRDYARWLAGSEIGRPLTLFDCSVEPAWIDYNGHMTEAAYLTAFGDASDALFRYIGIDEAYRAGGSSFYTVETHINYYREVSSGEPLRFSTQLLGLDEKRLHFFHTMFHGKQDDLLCTTEQMLVHVDRQASTAAPIKPDVYRALRAIMAAHTDMPVPKQVGRQMAIKKRK